MMVGLELGEIHFLASESGDSFASAGESCMRHFGTVQMDSGSVHKLHNLLLCWCYLQVSPPAHVCSERWVGKE